MRCRQIVCGDKKSPCESWSLLGYAIPTVCLDVTSLAVGIYGYYDGKNGPTRCTFIGAAHCARSGHTERQEGLHQQHAQPVAHVREGQGGRELLLRCVSAINDHTAITDKAMW
jgi:hypothetical protein